MSQVTSAIPSAVENAKRIGVLGSLVKGAITAIVSCVITCLIAVPATIYTAGARSATDREAAKRIADQVLIDHDGQIKLAGAVQNLSESVIALAARVSQMDAVHAEQMSSINGQLKSASEKIDTLGADVRTVNQNVLRLSERVK